MIPKTSWLKTPFVISVSVGEESEQGLAGFLDTGSFPRLWSHSKAWVGKDLLPCSLIGCWRDSVPGCQFLIGCWLEFPLRSLSCGPLHRGSPQHGTLCHQNRKARRVRERERLREVTVLYDQILEVTAHHFCCVLFVRRRSLAPLYPNGVDYERHEHQEVEGHWGPFQKLPPHQDSTHGCAGLREAEIHPAWVKNSEGSIQLILSLL